MRNDEPGKFLGSEHGALHVNVRIDKPGQQNFPLNVIALHSFIALTDPDDHAVFDADLTFFRFAREYIENPCIPDDKVTLSAFHRAVDQIFHNFCLYRLHGFYYIKKRLALQAAFPI